MLGMTGPRKLEVWKMGIVNYLDALKLQEKLVSYRKISILYPVISLREIGLGARNYVEKLESTMIELASFYGVKACAGQKGETGVWVGDRKIGTIGVRISYGITSHGLAFNIDPDFKYFKHVVPCGIANKEVTSLRRETGTVLPAEEVVHEQLISCFARFFGYSTITWKENPLILSDNEEIK
ncbi:hypothetical protein CRYUN_Cryun03dG0109700 [Craigia yunnanensis]